MKTHYDHALRGEELEQTAFADVAEDIARNPERRMLVAPDGFANMAILGIPRIITTPDGSPNQ